MTTLRHVSLAALATLLLSGHAWADVTSYTVKRVGGKTILTSVTARRGTGPVVFDASKLIGVRATHFRSTDRGIMVVPAGSGTPSAEGRARLLGPTLNEGLINPAGQAQPLHASPVLKGPGSTPGLAVVFDRPVVNLPGDDVVLFELQTQHRSALTGDPLHVCPLEHKAQRRSTTIRTYDITFDHPKAQFVDDFDLLSMHQPPRSMVDLQRGSLTRSSTGLEFKALAVGIDLTALGYGQNETVAGLFFQNAGVKPPNVDPVCIVGLPRPGAPNVLAKEPKTDPRGTCRTLEEALKGPLAGTADIVFAVRVPGNDHWYANFGYYSSPVREYPPQRAPDGVRLPPIYKQGGRLCKMDLRTRNLAVLLDDPKGGVRDPQVHYDGHKIVFSYRKGGQPYYHLYEIGVNGTNLAQLTDGPHNDIEPTYLPDGGIMFCSDRCNRFVNCWISPVATLYRCEGDGSGIRIISPNIEHDNTPWMLPDGRVAYMRWEYVDRSQSHFHHLWTTNPDGTAQMVLFGNQHAGFAMLDAKPIPGTDKLVASFSPGHGRPEHAGYVTIVDCRTGPDDLTAVRRISRRGPTYRDPYPLSVDCFLVAMGGEIRVMDGAGNTETIYRLPEAEKQLACHEPRPIRARTREPVIPSRVNATSQTGRLVLADVYKGRNMAGVRRGDITELLVLEQLPKPVNFSGGMWPISIGGTFTLARILGTVPVEPDGSAHMEVPALRSLFFVALDKHKLSVKRMHSFLTVQPGETTGCVGCHEKRLVPPPSQLADLAAVRRGPSRIRPVRDVPDVFDFPRDVQPILDKHCVRCHNPDRPDGGIDLCGDHTPLFSQSYWTIVQHGLIADGRNERYGNRPPRTTGSSASRLLTLLDGGHYGVRVSAAEKRRIRLWIDSSAPYAGTYAALGSGMCPVEFPVEVMIRRCGKCHASEPKSKHRIGRHPYFRFERSGPAMPLVHTFLDLQQIRARIGYYKFGSARPPQSLCNLSRPTKSLLLRAPLSKEAGGLGLCTSTVFASPDDPGYITILDAIRKASGRLAEEKRFDMPGFRPNDYYIHQMQRYGVLPKDLRPTGPVDPYQTDRAYWRSFQYQAPS